jgi:hypothetical protein
MIKNIAAEMNWDWRELGGVLDQLPKYHTATLGRGAQGGPMVITCAPKLPSLPAKRPQRETRAS